MKRIGGCWTRDGHGNALRHSSRSEASCDQGNDARQAAETDHCIANAKRPEHAGPICGLKRGRKPEQAEGGNGQKDQASDNGDDYSHWSPKCKQSVSSYPPVQIAAKRASGTPEPCNVSRESDSLHIWDTGKSPVR